MRNNIKIKGYYMAILVFLLLLPHVDNAQISKSEDSNVTEEKDNKPINYSLLKEIEKLSDTDKFQRPPLKLNPGSNNIIENVKIGNWGAKLQAGDILVSWTTLREFQNDFFVLERSGDGVQWTELAVILGEKNSNHQINYNFIDKASYDGINYYKLSHMNYNGIITKHSIIRIMNNRYLSKPKLIASIKPGMYRLEFNRNIEADAFNINLYNSAGNHVVFNQEIYGKQLDIEMEKNNPGINILVLQVNGQIMKYKLFYH